MKSPDMSNQQSFDPMQADPKAFRAALGQFGTGVTIVTCLSEAGPMGITANSFASLSLDPPLVTWAPARSSKRHDAFARAKHFAIHVLKASQAPLCARFAKDGLDFDGLDWIAGTAGTPLIENCLSRFECTRVALHEGGDHSLIIGQVEQVTTQAGTPLLFHGGRYGGFEAF